ncbi:phosphatidylserine decarboxylase, partial [Enterobacter hormaechei]|nr:phosphatidylserine decarboxylase [Enterobacter hormaechei]
TITPFHIQQHTPVYQGDRFSMIRYGSQVDLVIPVADDDELTSLVTEKEHVTGGMTRLVRINDNSL